MFELKDGNTGEVLDTQKNYADIMDSAGFYIGRGLVLEVWADGELLEEV